MAEPDSDGPQPGGEPAAPVGESSAAASSGGGAPPPAGGFRRLHPVSVLFGFGADARSLLLPGLLVLFAARRSDDPQVWAMFLVVPYALVAVVRYLAYRYAYSDSELIVQTGFLFRNRRHIPYSRIHNIGSVRNPLHRLFGVAEVRIETASGSEPEARIRVLSEAALEEMRRRVEAAKAGSGAVVAAAGEEAAPAPEGRVLVALRPRDLVTYGLIDNRGMVVVGAATGLLWQTGIFDRLDESALWERLSLSIQASSPSPLRIAALAALGVVAFLVAVRLLSLAWAFYKLWDFRLTLAGGELASESGLITRVTTAVPLHRVQRVTVGETPLHRLAGCAEVTAETAGGGDGGGGSAERQRLAPVLGRGEVAALVAAVLPGVDLDAVDWRPVDPRGERRMRRRGLAGSLVVTLAVVAATGPWGLVALPPLAAAAVWIARRRVRRYAWADTGDAVLFRSGWLWRKLSVARHAKLQAVGLGETPFDRRWGMASVRVDTAGAKASSHYIAVPYLDRDTANDLFDRLATAAATTTFRW